ncbi:MAG: arginine--tRNA ligase [Bacteroidales bacterium]|jgi:arginyl-tRNA synthetase|nr:arginine--tRNA ligase [Bacteroidales bacterium]
MNLENRITLAAQSAIEKLYGTLLDTNKIPLQQTRKDQKGDYTIVVFGFSGISKKKPEETAQELGSYLKENEDFITDFDVIKGFLNLIISDDIYISFLIENVNNTDFGRTPINPDDKVVVEYSSPNTNKPLHLGHIRNNLLGFSVSEILKANGKNVKKVNLVNDRGIHICKSMLAWQKWGDSLTPEIANLKGDKLVGNFYVLFDKKYKEEIAELVNQGMEKAIAEKEAPLLKEAQQMLLKWEENDAETRTLWNKMNSWVYAGFDITYKNMGVDFDKICYESETYLLGKKLVMEGLKNGVLFKKENGSIWCDLSEDGLDEKLLLRADGTSVYMTQDLGTAQLRHDDFEAKKMIYVVGNEQNYHFDVLKRVLKHLGKNWYNDIEHLSYGMVELPAGKMKSREGTVVDADELMEEMYSTAKVTTEELGKTENFSNNELNQLYRNVSLSALKYFILKVDPKRQMMFNPSESIDFNGNTGPFIQYTYARIKSILRKASEKNISTNWPETIDEKEKNVIQHLYNFPAILKQAGEQYSPALISNYIFDLVKSYNKFYQEISILKEDDEIKKNFRIKLSQFTAENIKNAMLLLGINVPERM